VGVFAGTNIDDIIVLTVLFLSARAIGKPRPWQIWAGQYAGIGVLVIVSAIAALGLTIVPDQRVELLGLVPFAFGLKGIVAAIRTRDQDQPSAPAVATGLLSVVGVTIANGADNISVYTPASHHRPDQQRSHRGRVRRRNRRLVPSRVLAWLTQRDHWGDTTVRELDCAQRLYAHRRSHHHRIQSPRPPLSTCEHDRHPRGEITHPRPTPRTCSPWATAGRARLAWAVPILLGHTAAFERGQWPATRLLTDEAAPATPRGSSSAPGGRVGPFVARLQRIIRCGG
jgi:hypothetical protein